MEILLTGKDAEKLAVKSFTSLTHFTYDYELNSRPFFISISGFCDAAALLLNLPVSVGGFRWKEGGNSFKENENSIKMRKKRICVGGRT